MQSFGVFIRSVGERTEELCRQAVSKHVDIKNIHLIRNRTPAWQAYDEMFRTAEEHQYDWYLGLDADVILGPEWLKTMSQKKHSLNPERVYDCSFPVLDYFTGVVDKGNHLFNGRFTRQARSILHEHTKDSIKPESGIFRHLPDQDSFYFQSIAPIGWHGYEQYNHDIYYRFFVLGARGKPLPKLFDAPDCYVAKQGWTAGRRHFLKKALQRWFGTWQGPTPDASYRDQFKHLSITEKTPLSLSLDQFRGTYTLNQHLAKPLVRPTYDLNRGTIKVPVQ